MALSIAALGANGDGFVWSATTDQTSVAVGQSIAVEVYLAPGHDFYEYNSAELYIRWDPSVFAVSDVKGLNLFKATALTEEAEPHIFLNRYTNSTTSMISWNEQRQVASFTLTALKDGVSELTLYRPQITQTVNYVPTPVTCSVASSIRLTAGSGQSASGSADTGNTGANGTGTPVYVDLNANPVQQPTTKPQTRPSSFADVPASHWAHEAVSFCVNLGLFTGTSATNFTPEGAVTRGMFMTVLARAAGVDTEGGATWYEKGQQWAMENEVSDGTNPELPLTREQLVTMLYRFVQSPMTDGSIGTYPDAGDASDFARDALCWATKYGIINGVNGMLSPKTGATRAQLAAILMRWSMVEA